MSASTMNDEDLDYVRDAREGLKLERVRGGFWLLTCVVGLFVAVLIWAANAPLDEVTRGQGRVIPSTAVQTIQNLEGGILAEILVSEGDRVEEGQILVRIDDTQSNASFQEQASQRDAMEAALARLDAEANGREEIIFTERILAARPDLVINENQLFEKRRDEMKEQTILMEKGLGLAREQLAIVKPLVEKNVHPRLELLKLEREIADLEGRLREVTGGFQQKAMESLTDQRTRLESLRKTLEGREDRVRRALVRSPVGGTVNKVHAKTVGGVVGPGEPIADIVPDHETLLVEAEIRPADIAFLHPEQEVMVKFTAYDFALYGGLDGVVETISADTIHNEIDGQHYYQIKVRIDEGTLERNGEVLPIISGMVTEVNVLTGQRTVLQYLLKPFYRARVNALTER